MPCQCLSAADMSNGSRRGVVCSFATASVLLLLASAAPAQSPRLKNIQMCNGVDNTSAEPQMQGCTALIDSGNEKPNVLAIAYNNRGNAYAAKRDWDRAIQDYDQSIKLNPVYA